MLTLAIPSYSVYISFSGVLGFLGPSRPYSRIENLSGEASFIFSKACYLYLMYCTQAQKIPMSSFHDITLDTMMKIADTESVARTSPWAQDDIVLIWTLRMP